MAPRIFDASLLDPFRHLPLSFHVLTYVFLLPNQSVIYIKEMWSPTFPARSIFVFITSCFGLTINLTNLQINSFGATKAKLGL